MTMDITGLNGMVKKKKVRYLRNLFTPMKDLVNYLTFNGIQCKILVQS